MNHALKIGDFLRCLHSRQWHPVVKWHTSGTDFTLKMLYFECKVQRFYAGRDWRVGTKSILIPSLAGRGFCNC